MIPSSYDSNNNNNIHNNNNNSNNNLINQHNSTNQNNQKQNNNNNNLKFNSNRETISQEMALLRLKEKSLRAEKRNQQQPQTNKKVINYAQFL